MEDALLIDKAQNGDMSSFDILFRDIQPKLRAYLFRMTADLDECDDIIQDVFIKTYENISGFRQESSFKTWVFTIATNHTRKLMKKQSRWHVGTQTKIKELAHEVPELMHELEDTNNLSPHGVFEIKEHIDYCFTCVTKMLRIEEQLVILLKEIFEFKINEISRILQFSESKVKHALRDGRKNMIDIFDENCALVSKNGICDQCTGLNGKFNPKQDTRKKLMEIRMIKAKSSKDYNELLDLRMDLCRGIDPLQASGTKLHEVFFKLGHLVNN